MWWFGDVGFNKQGWPFVSLILELFIHYWCYDTIQWSNFWYYVQSKKHPRHVKAIYLENVRCTVEKQHLCKSPSRCWAVGGSQAQSKVEMYSESSGWKELPPLPTARLRSAVVAGRVTMSEQDSTCWGWDSSGFSVSWISWKSDLVRWTTGHLFCSLDDLPFDFRSMSTWARGHIWCPKERLIG